MTINVDEVNEMVNVTINATGMHCPSCEMLVVDSLEEIDGVMGAAASHTAGTVSVNFDDSKVSIERIKAVIRSEGYEVD